MPRLANSSSCNFDSLPKAIAWINMSTNRKRRHPPTVSVDTIFTVLNIAAYKQMKGFVMDIPGAYIPQCCELKDPQMVKFPRALAALYTELYPEYLTSLQPGGSLLL
jgi:hypothetical protein